jgi:MerR family transcriptional regulator, light-induced transcriptional regulator
MNDFTIKDLENLSGIKAHTIRMWEQRYNFLKPQRTDTNIRYYSSEDLKTILNIALLNKYGYKLCHIDCMQPDEICAKILSLTDTQAVQERMVNDLVKQMVELDKDKFESIINKYIQAHDIEKTVHEIIFPFLEKIGILWQTGHLMPAQEHFVSNIIRQKLVVAIDSITPPRKIPKKAVLFLPEGEHHELGLLFLYYLLKRRGIKVIYLGANIPISDVESVVEVAKPDIAFIHLTSVCRPNFSCEKLAVSIPSRLGKLPVVISGYPAHTCCSNLPSSVSLKKSLTEVTDFISAL